VAPSPKKKRKPMRDKALAWKALLSITGVLKQLKVPYCLDGGTLLGFYREGWFFPHDKDVDLTLLDQHARLPEIKRLARKAGFKVWRHQTVGESGCAKLQLPRHGVMVDIVSKHERDGLAYWALIQAPEHVKSMPARYYRDLATILVRGHEFSIPADTESYLAERFGDDWRTPRPEWNRYEHDRAYPSVRGEP
jgi:phosphorylcholine metabolism protein LicD